jgi:Holliday junction resolvasome RuvABC DNA-binding subunit
VPVSSALNDVVSTLVNMGYEKNDVEKVLAWLPKDMTDIGEIIPYVIKHI